MWGFIQYKLVYVIIYIACKYLIVTFQIMRYTLDMADWTLKEGPKDLIPDTELNHSFEFSNINPSYLGKKYK